MAGFGPAPAPVRGPSASEEQDEPPGEAAYLTQLRDLRLPPGEGSCCYIMAADCTGCTAKDSASFLPGLLYLPALRERYLREADLSECRACLLLAPLPHRPAEAEDCKATFRAVRDLVGERSGGLLGTIIVVFLAGTDQPDQLPAAIPTLHAAAFAAGVDNVLMSHPGAPIGKTQLQTAVLTAEFWHDRLDEVESREAHKQEKWGQKYKAQLRKLIWSTPDSVFPHIPQEDPDLLEEEGSVGDYHLIRTIGQGGFGMVYLAQHEEQGRVAVKTINKATIKRIDDLASVEQEIRILREVLDHPNVLKVHCCLHGKSSIYIVMDFLGKYTLHEYICLKQRTSRRNPSLLSIDEVLEISGHVMKALAHCHDHDICHRDIKCKNLMIDSMGRVTLIDFGLAVQAAADRTLHESVGSLPFVAPEVLLATKEAPYDGFAADVWGFGVLLQELVCGLGSSDEIIGLPPGETDMDAPELAERCASMSRAYTQELAMSVAGNDLSSAIRTGLATVWRGTFALDPQARPSIQTLAQVEAFRPHVGLLAAGAAPAPSPASTSAPTPRWASPSTAQARRDVSMMYAHGEPPDFSLGPGLESDPSEVRERRLAGHVGWASPPYAGTLLHRLGGPRAVHSVVVTAYDLFLALPDFAKYFLACPMKMGRIRSGIATFMENLFSSPESCDLEWLDRVHRSLTISDGLFSNFVDILLDAFQKEVKPQDIFEIQQTLETLRSFITSGYRARLALAQAWQHQAGGCAGLFMQLGLGVEALAEGLRCGLARDVQLRALSHDNWCPEDEDTVAIVAARLVQGDVDGAAHAAFGDCQPRAHHSHAIVSAYGDCVRRVLQGEGVGSEEAEHIAAQLEHHGERVVRRAREPRTRAEVFSDAETKDWFVQTLVQLCTADPFLRHFAERPGFVKCAAAILELASGQDGGDRLERVQAVHRDMHVDDERFGALLTHVGAVLRAILPWPAYPAAVCAGALRALQSARTDVLYGSTLQKVVDLQEHSESASEVSRTASETSASAEASSEASRDLCRRQQELLQAHRRELFTRLKQDPRVSVFFQSSDGACLLRKATGVGLALGGKLPEGGRETLRRLHACWKITHYDFDIFCEHVETLLGELNASAAGGAARNLGKFRREIVSEASRCPFSGASGGASSGCPFGKGGRPSGRNSTGSADGFLLRETRPFRRLVSEGGVCQIVDDWEREMLNHEDLPMVTEGSQLPCKAKVRRFLLTAAGDSAMLDGHVSRGDAADAVSLTPANANAKRAREAHQSLGITPALAALSIQCFERAMASYGVQPQVASRLTATLERLAHMLDLMPPVNPPGAILKWPSLDVSKLDVVREELSVGGGLEGLIESWCSKVLEDATISPFFTGARNRIKMFQTAFWTEVLQGHVPTDHSVELRLMRVHAHCRIGPVHFDAFVACLTSACRERGVSQSATATLQSSVESFRLQVVNVDSSLG